MAESDPLGKNWKMWGGILAFIAVVVILGLIFVPKTTPNPEAATPTLADTPSPSAPAQSPTASASAAKPSTGDCPALSTDNSFPNDAPKTEWKRHPAGMLLPVSSEHGPAKQDGDFWRCFSHTPTGALYAAITLSFDFTGSLVPEAATESAQRDSILSQLKPELAGGAYPVIQGFRVMASDDESASVEYLIPSGTDFASLRWDVVWSEADHDWRLDVSNGIPEASQVSDPSTFTRWE